MIRHKLSPLMESLSYKLAGPGNVTIPLTRTPARRERAVTQIAKLFTPTPGGITSTLGGDVLGRQGALEVRLASTARELRQAQRLRFRVFYEEMSARADPLSALLRRDADRFDRVCDHLIVTDHAAPGEQGAEPPVVGTYRLLRQEVAERNFGFYSQSEFEIAPLLAAHRDKRFLELGRSCVLPCYRDKRTLELLWRGIHAYVARHGIDVMIGCASIEGTDPAVLASHLDFLHRHAPCPDGWRVQAKGRDGVPMRRLAGRDVDPRQALRTLPSLIKGYLRLGASFGEGAVVDYQFGTTDVFVLLRADAIARRYASHFERVRMAA